MSKDALSDLLGSQPASVDKLDAVRAAAREMRDLALEIGDIEATLKTKSGRMNHLKSKHLPDLMGEASVDRIGLEAEGNMPAWDFTAKPYYKANIAADWDPERQARGFSELGRLGAGDLIRTEVTVIFGAREHDKAQKLVARLVKAGYEPISKLSVPWNTLTAWLRERYTKSADDPSIQTPNLDLIGATVGRIVDGKERKQ